jgi:teichoic acid transport system permease protein
MSITNLFLQTPWWVVIVAAVLISRGIRDLRPTTIPLPMLGIMPAVFAVGGLYELVRLFPFDMQSVLLWSGATAIGAILGLLVECMRPMRVDRQQRLITMGGSRTTLVMMITFLMLNFIINAVAGSDSSIFSTPWFLFISVGMSGVITGAFIGRLLCWWLAWRSQPNEHLVIS